jgi:hypothetical protein
VKAYLKAYNRKKDYIYDLAQYMFTKFIHIVSNRDWSCTPSHNNAAGTV